MKKILYVLALTGAVVFGIAQPSLADCTITNNSSDDGVIICTTTNGNGNPGSKKPKIKINNNSTTTNIITAGAFTGGQTVKGGEDVSGVTINPGNATVNVRIRNSSGNVFIQNTFNQQPPIFPF